jgi:hypothetical protein
VACTPSAGAAAAASQLSGRRLRDAMHRREWRGRVELVRRGPERQPTLDGIARAVRVRCALQCHCRLRSLDLPQGKRLQRPRRALGLRQEGRLRLLLSEVGAGAPRRQPVHLQWQERRGPSAPLAPPRPPARRGWRGSAGGVPPGVTTPAPAEGSPQRHVPPPLHNSHDQASGLAENCLCSAGMPVRPPRATAAQVGTFKSCLMMRRARYLLATAPQ